LTVETAMALVLFRMDLPLEFDPLTALTVRNHGSRQRASLQRVK